MNEKISAGNAFRDGQNNDQRGWFIGAFVKQSELQTKAVEIKWGIHEKGEHRFSKATQGNATTVSILISGHYRITFENGAAYDLKDQGDYLIWSPNLPHVFDALENSVAVTVRWPSLSSEKN